MVTSLYATLSERWRPFDSLTEIGRIGGMIIASMINMIFLIMVWQNERSMDAEDFNLNDPEKLDYRSFNAHKLSKVLSNPRSLDQLDGLSRTLSTSRRSNIKIDVEDFDLKEFLESIVQRSTEADLGMVKLGVTFEDLTAYGRDDTVKYMNSVYEMVRSILSLPGKVISKFKSPLWKIIRNVDGLVKPGEMLLVLGRPGAGCSTLLKTLAGQTRQLKGVEGRILYDGVDQAEITKRFKHGIIYNPEVDIHFPHLTVEQTIRFAVAARTPRTRLDGMSRREYEDLMVEFLGTIFGLRHAYQTKVGDEYVKGCSGGERKRVAIAEALATRGSLFCWDDATRGLDSANALEFAQAMRLMSNVLGNSTIVAIQQASDSIYELFDKVSLMYDGRQVYLGPVDSAKQYFETMGYECPPRQSTSEFLTAVTDPNCRYLKPEIDQGSIPQTAEEFEDYWKRSSHYAEIKNEITDYNQNKDYHATLRSVSKANMQMNTKNIGQTPKYALSYSGQFILCLKRGVNRIVNNRQYYVINAITAVVLAITMGSLFFNIPDATDGAFLRGGIVFFTLLYVIFVAFSEIPMSFPQRQVLLKQTNYQLIQPSIEALQDILTSNIARTGPTVCYGTTMYFMANLNRTAGQYFLFLIMLVSTDCTMNTFFKAVSACNVDVSMATSVAGLCMMVSVIMTGFLMPRPNLGNAKWMEFITWLLPTRYGFDSIMSNEFHGRHMKCDNIVPSGPGYENIPIANKVCAFPGAILGHSTVVGDDYVQASFFYEWDQYWRNFAIIIGFFVVFVAVTMVATFQLRQEPDSGETMLFKRGHVPSNTAEELVAVSDSFSRHLSTIQSTEVFTWQNVDYSIPIKNGTRKLLDNIQGYVKPGTMTALMGESGAGKTTLLNVLSQRIHGVGVVTGDFLVNGKPIDASFQRRSGYVQQQDVHLKEFSVRESLQFAARLRQPRDVPDKEKMEYVESIIEVLGMTKYAEAIVGDLGRGLNVEQRKKLSIGVELVAKPSLLLFLDEPTSGLDSQSAWAIVKFLKSLTAAGQSILCTVHQPSAVLFEQFDRLLLLQKGGQTVYFGDIGPNSSVVLEYFASKGARVCEKHENPAEYILECVGAGATATSSNEWGQLWNQSQEFTELTSEIKTLNSEMAQNRVEVDSHLKTRFAAGILQQFCIVYKRTVAQIWRSPVYVLARTVLALCTGLFTGLAYLQLDEGVRSLQNSMFGILIAAILGVPLSAQIQEFTIRTRDIYEAREWESNTFHWLLLPLVQFATELPMALVTSLVFYLPFYFLVGFDTSASVAGYFFLFYIIILQIYDVSFALWTMYMAPDAQTATLITSTLYIFVVTFCGVMVPKSQIPHFWQFMYRISPYTYVIQSLLGVVLHDKKVVCNDDELSLLIPPPDMTCEQYLDPFVKAAGGYVKATGSGCAYCQYKIGDEYLETLSIDFPAYKWRNVGILCAFIVFNLAAAVLSFWLFRIKGRALFKRGKRFLF